MDEIHNLNLGTRTRAGAEVSDQLKNFAERLPATFIYAGIAAWTPGSDHDRRGRAQRRELAAQDEDTASFEAPLRVSRPSRPTAVGKIR